MCITNTYTGVSLFFFYMFSTLNIEMKGVFWELFLLVFFVCLFMYVASIWKIALNK